MSAEAPGAALLDVVAVMDRLRSPGGCPWDAEQTHESLTRYLVEETYEVLDAVEALDGTPAAEAELAEELGDVLLQVVFHARVAAGRGAFDVDDVARTLAAKLRRRHPHVFGDEQARTGEAVQARWDELKAQEKPARGPVDGIPRHLPALARADKLLQRLERAGLPVPAAPDGATTEQDRVGEELLAAVVRARAAGVDPEAALRARVRSVESGVAGGAGPSR
ncbi:MazG family protein [Aquipuribacter hungaricus]|uniref:MazG family protein n=1 Tax=Aquipuribacter hungaricus TaxID=545624 RepID=A0ABV7WBT8_9MICO